MSFNPFSVLLGTSLPSLSSSLSSSPAASSSSSLPPSPLLCSVPGCIISEYASFLTLKTFHDAVCATRKTRAAMLEGGKEAEDTLEIILFENFDVFSRLNERSYELYNVAKSRAGVWKGYLLALRYGKIIGLWYWPSDDVRGGFFKIDYKVTTTTTTDDSSSSVFCVVSGAVFTPQLRNRRFDGVKVEGCCGLSSRSMFSVPLTKSSIGTDGGTIERHAVVKVEHKFVDDQPLDAPRSFGPELSRGWSRRFIRVIYTKVDGVMSLLFLKRKLKRITCPEIPCGINSASSHARIPLQSLSLSSRATPAAEPPSILGSLRGVYAGSYGPHGIEHVLILDSVEFPDESQSQSGGVPGVAHAAAAAAAAAAGPTPPNREISLAGLKITGDPNVPAGKLTFYLTTPIYVRSTSPPSPAARPRDSADLLKCSCDLPCACGTIKVCKETGFVHVGKGESFATSARGTGSSASNGGSGGDDEGAVVELDESNNGANDDDVAYDHVHILSYECYCKTAYSRPVPYSDSRWSKGFVHVMTGEGSVVVLVVFKEVIRTSIRLDKVGLELDV